MFKITKKEWLADNIFLMDIEAPRVARTCMPGQFVIVIAQEKGERVPLTICDYNREAGTVTIVVQTVGAETTELGEYEAGDSVRDFVGPLGNASDLTKLDHAALAEKKIVFMAGGLGTAPIYPQVKWLHEQGISCDVIIGARNKSLIILEERMKEVAGNVYVCTDDGSYGFHGNCNAMLTELVKNRGKVYNHAVAIGPLIMMKFACVLTKELGIPTVVSMNPIMVDGTGMCGACRVVVGGQVRFACVDGPEFDGHLVDFDQAMKRQQIYKTEEGRRLLAVKEGATHSGHCALDK